MSQVMWCKILENKAPDPKMPRSNAMLAARAPQPRRDPLLGSPLPRVTPRLWLGLTGLPPQHHAPQYRGEGTTQGWFPRLPSPPSLGPVAASRSLASGCYELFSGGGELGVLSPGSLPIGSPYMAASLGPAFCTRRSCRRPRADPSLRSSRLKGALPPLRGQQCLHFTLLESPRLRGQACFPPGL